MQTRPAQYRVMLHYKNDNPINCKFSIFVLFSLYVCFSPFSLMCFLCSSSFFQFPFFYKNIKWNHKKFWQVLNFCGFGGLFEFFLLFCFFASIQVRDSTIRQIQLPRHIFYLFKVVLIIVNGLLLVQDMSINDKLRITVNILTLWHRAELRLKLK